jgi:outer membrane protein assembly factor BamD (BamD/ComL family)
MDEGLTPPMQGGLQKKPSDTMLIKKLEKTMEKHMKNDCYTNAIFFADKILTLSIFNDHQLPKAVYDLANAYYMNKEYICLILNYDGLIMYILSFNVEYISDVYN